MAKVAERMEPIDMGRMAGVVELARGVAAKAVISVVVCTLEEFGQKGESLDAVVRTFEEARAPLGRSTCMKIEFEGEEFRLMVALTLVDREYKTEVDLPGEQYVKGLFEIYQALREFAIAYWAQFLEDNPTMMGALRGVAPGVDFGRLVVDDVHRTTMYFDAGCAKRVGIFCFYVDGEDKIYYKLKNGKVE